jgi:DNA-directed RNA polymerase subunit RPC12/RpoP
MLTLECPWCDGPVTLEAEADDVACDGCSVRVELAPDPRPMVTARAA